MLLEKHLTNTILYKATLKLSQCNYQNKINMALQNQIPKKIYKLCQIIDT